MNVLKTLRANPTLLLCLALFFVAFSVSAYLSAAYPKPVGADIVFHLEVVDAYLHGENGMFAAHVMEINRMPYPPLFHLMLVPARALSLDNGFIRVLQALVYPCCLLGALLLMYRYGFRRGVFAVGLGLLGSMAFVDATLQIRPESLDVVFWLVLVYAQLEGRFKLGVVSAVLGVYNHSFGSLVLSGGALLFEVKRHWKQLLAVALLCSPIIVITFLYIPSMFGKWMGAYASPQARSFVENFFGFSFTYLGGLVAALPIAVYSVFKWRSLSGLGRVSVLTLACSLLMVPIWYDRYWHYASVPLALLAGEFCSESGGGWRRVVQVLVVGYFVVWCLLVQLNLWATNALGYWDFH